VTSSELGDVQIAEIENGNLNDITDEYFEKLGILCRELGLDM